MQSWSRLTGTIATFTPTSGTVYGVTMWTPGGETFSEVGVYTVAAAATPTHQWAGIANAAGTILAISADTTGAYGGVGTLVMTAVTTAITTPGDGGPLIFFWMDAATTAATLGSILSAANLIGLPPLLAASYLTGQTTPPAVGSALGAATAIANVPFIGAA